MNKSNLDITITDPKIRAISLISMIWLLKKWVTPWSPTLWFRTINNKKVCMKKKMRKNNNIIGNKSLMVTKKKKSNNNKKCKNVMKTLTKELSVTSMKWHWATQLSPTNKTITCSINSNISNLHKNNQPNRKLWCNKTSLTIKMNKRKRKVHKNKLKFNKNNNKLMLIYRHLTNTSLKMMETTSHNLIKCRMNKWVLRWCRINIKTKNKKKKNKNNNNRLTNQSKFNVIKLLTILNNNKKATSTN